MKVIGLMSGTSIDGIDTVLVELEGKQKDLKVEFLGGETYTYSPKVREQILKVCGGEPLSMAELAALDDAIASSFAQAAQQIQQKHCAAELIGSHGQTVYHRPPKISEGSLGYSLQLGRGEVIANTTGVTTVSNFRAADIAAGGQGAPLVSKVDAYLLSHPHKHRAIQNLGGIANVTYLPPNSRLNWDREVFGWDTGPANILLDLAIQKLTDGKQNYDKDGQWAAQGTPCKSLIFQWLKQDFFLQSPPKSTGRELFGSEYLAQCWQEAQAKNLSEADWLATLTELTVASIVHSYEAFLPQIPDEVLLCGGGSRNIYLRQRLQAELTSTKILTTDQVGLNGDYKEAIAFAILAYWKFCSFPGNLPRVTGAKQPMLLGTIHHPLI